MQKVVAHFRTLPERLARRRWLTTCLRRKICTTSQRNRVILATNNTGTRRVAVTRTNGFHAIGGHRRDPNASGRLASRKCGGARKSDGKRVHALRRKGARTSARKKHPTGEFRSRQKKLLLRRVGGRRHQFLQPRRLSTMYAMSTMLSYVNRWTYLERARRRLRWELHRDYRRREGLALGARRKITGCARQ